MKKRKKLGRKLLSFLLTLAMLVGLMPGMGLTAYADNTEKLLTTITPTDETTYSQSVEGMVTVTLDNIRYYDNRFGWLYRGTVTVEPVEGYTITKCRFKQNDKTPLDDDLAPFSIVMNMDDFWNACSVTTSTGQKGGGSMDGVTSIEVYGYANKTAQTITAENVTATYGDTDKSVTASVTTPATGGGAISYTVKEGSGDYIDVASDGKLTIKKVPSDGKAYVIVTAAETDDYAEATKEVVVTISQAEVTVTAKDQSIYVGGTVPTLEGEDFYTVTGLVGEDALTTAPVLAYQKDGSAATPDNTTAGTYDIVASGAAASDNYTITYANGTLTISEKQPATVTKAPEAKTLTYTGSAQALVTAGEATGGEMQYALGDETEATQPYTTSIPTATEAGTYYVWYKVVGDENHTDTEPKVVKVTIDAAQGETEIKTEVKTDEKSPKIETSDLTQEVAESTLTDEEKAIIDEAVNDGKDVNVDVYLAIHDIADEITAEDKAKLEAEASDAGQLAYFDISLLKEIIVDGSSHGATRVHELQKPLKLTMGVPNSFPAVESGYTRTYVVLRLHNGEVTTLPATVNADGTISFETDRFSVYALVYKDTKDATTTEATTATTAAASTSDATTASTTTEAAKTSPKTGDSMPIAVLVVLMFAAAGMLVFMDLKKKKN